MEIFIMRAPRRKGERAKRSGPSHSIKEKPVQIQPVFDLALSLDRRLDQAAEAIKERPPHKRPSLLFQLAEVLSRETGRPLEEMDALLFARLAALFFAQNPTLKGEA